MIFLSFLTSKDKLFRTQAEELLQELSPRDPPRSVSRLAWDMLLSDKDVSIAVAYEKPRKRRVLVGMASIFFTNKLLYSVAEIDDVIVTESRRGEGLGKKLTVMLISRAQEYSNSIGKSVVISLTSKPAREAANALYLKLGFVCVSAANGEKGTNLYRLTVSPAM